MSNVRAKLKFPTFEPSLNVTRLRFIHGFMGLDVTQPYGELVFHIVCLDLVRRKTYLTKKKKLTFHEIYLPRHRPGATANMTKRELS